MTKDAIREAQVAEFLQANMKSSADRWRAQPVDNPSTLNGFNGTWNFSDHRYIPEPILAFLEEYYFSVTRLQRVPIEDINELMNEVWQGPGSMPMLVERTYELANLRRQSSTVESATVLKDIAVRTIDEYDS